MVPLEYSVKAVPFEEFLILQDLVLLSANSRRSDVRSTPLIVNTVTDNMYRFLQIVPGDADRKPEQYLGLANGYSKCIWVRGDRPATEVKKTLLHEISHLAVEDQSHGPKWRRVFGVALAHWGRRYLDWDEDTVGRYIASDVVWRYRHYRAYTPQGRPNSFTEYAQRNETEIDRIHKASQR